MLVRIIYASEAKTKIDVPMSRAILEKAQENNERNDLTGMLVFNSRYFLQAIEGSPQKINALYNVLMTDPRHTNLFILGYEHITERMYGEWRMNYATLNEANKRAFLKYSPSSVFNPYELTAENALRFMQDLSALTMGVEEEAAPSPKRSSGKCGRSPISTPPRPPTSGSGRRAAGWRPRRRGSRGPGRRARPRRARGSGA